MIKVILFFLEGAVETRSVIPAWVGRTAKKGKPVSGIKRLYRLYTNVFLTTSLMENFLLFLFKRLIKDGTYVTLVMDWTVIRCWHFFSVSLVINSGRTIPIIFRGYKRGKRPKGKKIETQIEKETLALIFTILKEKQRVSVLADRGFDKPRLLKWIQEMGHDYLVRVARKNYITLKSGKRIRLTSRTVKFRGHRMHYKIRFTEACPILTNFYGVWDSGQEEAWLMISNIRFESARKAASEYAKRMRIEEMFRSFKDQQNGFDLKQVKIRNLDRWFRFLFLSVLLFHILAKLGMLLRQVLKIEQNFSLSSRPPKGQDWIFSIYSLAAHVLLYSRIALKWRKNSLFYREIDELAWRELK